MNTEKWIIRFAVTVVVYFLLSVCWQVAHADDTAQDRVAGYIRHFRRNLDPRFTQRVVNRYSPMIYRHAGDDLDPLLLAVVLAAESSFRPEVKGRDGEIGMAQVNPRAWPRFADKLKTPSQQIRAGAYILKYCQRFCGGEPLGTLACWHQSRKCTPGKRAKYKNEMYKNAVELFGKQQKGQPR